MKAYVLLLVVLLNYLKICSQSAGPDLILTKSQNERWLESIKAISFENQLKSIKNRLLSDTNVFVREHYPDGLRGNDSLGSRVYGDGKPTIIVNGYEMQIGNSTKTSGIINLTNLFTSTYIRDIKIISPGDGRLLFYGTQSQFGFIIMTVTKKKYSKLFRRLSKNHNGALRSYKLDLSLLLQLESLH